MKQFTVVIMKADTPNANGRIYSRATLEAAVKKVEDSAGLHGRLFGQIGMPEGGLDLAKASHIVGNLRFNEANELIGDVVLMETPQGKIAAELLDAGVSYDFRTAGYGTVSVFGEVKDFVIHSINMVKDGA
jgi:hypothetical protein